MPFFFRHTALINRSSCPIGLSNPRHPRGLSHRYLQQDGRFPMRRARSSSQHHRRFRRHSGRQPPRRLRTHLRCRCHRHPRKLFDRLANSHPRFRSHFGVHSRQKPVSKQHAPVGCGQFVVAHVVPSPINVPPIALASSGVSPSMHAPLGIQTEPSGKARMQ